MYRYLGAACRTYPRRRCSHCTRGSYHHQTSVVFIIQRLNFWISIHVLQSSTWRKNQWVRPHRSWTKRRRSRPKNVHPLTEAMWLPSRRSYDYFHGLSKLKIVSTREVSPSKTSKLSITKFRIDHGCIRACEEIASKTKPIFFSQPESRGRDFF